MYSSVRLRAKCLTGTLQFADRHRKWRNLEQQRWVRLFFLRPKRGGVGGLVPFFEVGWVKVRAWAVMEIINWVHRLFWLSITPAFSFSRTPRSFFFLLLSVTPGRFAQFAQTQIKNLSSFCFGKPGKKKILAVVVRKCDWNRWLAPFCLPRKNSKFPFRNVSRRFFVPSSRLSEKRFSSFSSSSPLVFFHLGRQGTCIARDPSHDFLLATLR